MMKLITKYTTARDMGNKHTRTPGLVMTLLHELLGDVEIFNGDMRTIKGENGLTLITSEFYNMMEQVYDEIIDLMTDELRDNEDYSYRYTDYDGLLDHTSRYDTYTNHTTADQKRTELEWGVVVAMVDLLVAYELDSRENS